jgi:hypothetical protein
VGSSRRSKWTYHLSILEFGCKRYEIDKYTKNDDVGTTSDGPVHASHVEGADCRPAELRRRARAREAACSPHVGRCGWLPPRRGHACARARVAPGQPRGVCQLAARRVHGMRRWARGFAPCMDSWQPRSGPPLVGWVDRPVRPS